MNQETIGKNIRKARRDRDMTQDELAAMLNVSESAVSQWESGKTSPDLGIIPDLCTVLEISADWLLGVDQEKKRKEVEEIVERAGAYSARGREDRAVEILEEGLKKYPNSDSIIHKLMYCTDDTDRQIELGEWLLEHSTVDDYRQDAIQCLVFSYVIKGDRKRAEKLACSMPCYVLSSDVLLEHVLEGEELENHKKRRRSDMIDDLANSILREQKIDRELAARKVIGLFELMFEDGDYGFNSCHLYDAWLWLARAAAGRGEEKETLQALGEAEKHAFGYMDYVNAKEYTHTSVLFAKTFQPNVSMNYTENTASHLLEEMNDPRYDFIRDTEDFQAITARLTPAAGEWEIKEPEKTE